MSDDTTHLYVSPPERFASRPNHGQLCVSRIERSIGTPAFTAVQIRRPSGRFQGVLNFAAAVYYSSDYPILK
ncbi:hypothetical protein ACS0TY_018080 [Phlomoides rotata]